MLAPKGETPTSLVHTLLAMCTLVEARDPYTGGHLWRVSRLAALLAEGLGLSAAETARISLGGFLHDLGKIAVPDNILRKPGPLSDGEYAIMQTHPHVGARLIATHPLGDLVSDAILHHHERPDGRGYPYGLGSEHLSMDALIVGVCDAFDAMTSTRPYRHGMDIGKALGVIRNNLGSQFDDRVGRRFLVLGQEGRFDPVVGHSDDGMLLQPCPRCGPTLVIQRGAQVGECLFCRNCGSEHQLIEHGETLASKPTGRVGNPADLEPQLDALLLQELATTYSTALWSKAA